MVVNLIALWVLNEEQLAAITRIRPERREACGRIIAELITSPDEEAFAKWLKTLDGVEVGYVEALLMTLVGLTVALGEGVPNNNGQLTPDP